jgi:hypothetical protein
MSEISLYIDSHPVGKRAKRIFSRRMWMVLGFGLNHTSESSVRAKYTIYLPSFLAAIHYYVAFPLADILFITKDPLLVPQESRNVYVHSEGSVMDIHRELQTCSACQYLPTLPFWSKSDYPSWSYCSFFIKFLKF